MSKLSDIFIVLTLLAITWSVSAASEKSLPAEETIREHIEELSPEADEDQQFLKLIEICREKSRAAYVPQQPLPRQLAELDYDAYRKIQFRQEKGIWRSLENPFWIEAFHRGFVHHQKVTINVIENGQVREIPFSPSLFHYGDTIPEFAVPQPQAAPGSVASTEVSTETPSSPEFEKPVRSLNSGAKVSTSVINENTGFAGIKLIGQFPQHDTYQELLTFIGASYFRAHTAETVYGVSNRGLAINIGLNKQEEFPAFREFWVVHPEQNQKQLVVYAQLESPSCVGAYKFILQPNQTTVELDVESEIFFRSIPEKVAVAPMTSMWMWGNGQKPPALETRPHVHDSDGLLIHDADRWVWRPLSRHPYVSVCRLDVNTFKGFGLSQRNIDFEDYRDTGALYHNRPSIWITPEGDWPEGHIELLELDATHEGIDNIGAYWVVDQPVTLNEPLKMHYSITWSHGELNMPERVTLATVQNTDVQRSPEGDRLNVSITFTSPGLCLNADEKPLEHHVQVIRGQLQDAKVVPVTLSTCRLELSIDPESDAPVEIYSDLHHQGEVVSEYCRLLISPVSPEYSYPQVYLRK